MRSAFKVWSGKKLEKSSISSPSAFPDYGIATCTRLLSYMKVSQFFPARQIDISIAFKHENMMEDNTLHSYVPHSYVEDNECGCIHYFSPHYVTNQSDKILSLE